MAVNDKKNDIWKDRYKKWDGFNDDTDSEDEKEHKPMRFDMGSEKIVVKDVMYVKPNEVDYSRRLPRKDIEVWQVVVRKLRVWSASSKGDGEGSGAIPCRPYCLMLNNLYPLGQVLDKQLCDPPESAPLPSQIMALIYQNIVNPSTDGIAQHRPGKVVFPDRDLAGSLSKSLSALGIEATQLSESEGVQEFVDEFSNYLVRKDMASRADVNLHPGLCSQPNVTVRLVRAVWEAAAALRAAEPWKQLGERQTFSLTAAHAVDVDCTKEQDETMVSSGSTCSSGGTGTVVTVPAGRVWVSVLGSQDSVQGVGVFYSKSDMEMRMLPPGEVLADLEDPGLRSCATCGTRQLDLGRDLRRCTRCSQVFYCNQACQKEDWKEHKRVCKPPAVREAGKMFWAARESTVLFENPTACPFDDLDTFDRLGLEVEEGESKAYPIPLTYRNGESTRPTVEELVWIERALLAVLEILRTSPRVLLPSYRLELNRAAAAARRGGRAVPGAGESGSLDGEVQIEVKTRATTGATERLTVHNAVVLTEREVAAAKAKMESKAKLQQERDAIEEKATTPEDSGASPEGGDGAGAGAGVAGASKGDATKQDEGGSAEPVGDECPTATSKPDDDHADVKAGGCRIS